MFANIVFGNSVQATKYLISKTTNFSFVQFKRFKKEESYLFLYFFLI